MAVWDDPDVDLLYEINGVAESAPGWADRAMGFVGEYGVIAGLVLLGLLAWWRVARRRETREEAVSAFAGLMWTPLAAGIALLVNIPIREFVERPRPFLEHKGLEVLVQGKDDYSFVSDHSTLAMALAVGIFMVHRRYGLLGIVLAVLAGFSRVYMGVHYPTDVVGGLALGAAMTLLLAPGASWALTPLARSLAGSPRAGALVWVGPGRRAEDVTSALREEPVEQPAEAPSVEGPTGGSGAAEPARRCHGGPDDSDLAA
ncbi:phosphatase PAP2 family protein [Streptomyces sp. WMMB 322]|uniref:phosphatase PAP2 family protein n=1 Tax=Streptomyces sp. WMMB 322 TaxID=1286821 RepID=UPI0006E2D14C|nr:phosphatase PAP2 family protein [Streptomyces sp. WMMB 322]SCK04904.1 undecaprenyl-diphosphatase [Streptomyces sp. WMMB 322]